MEQNLLSKPTRDEALRLLIDGKSIDEVSNTLQLSPVLVGRLKTIADTKVQTQTQSNSQGDPVRPAPTEGSNVSSNTNLTEPTPIFSLRNHTKPTKKDHDARTFDPNHDENNNNSNNELTVMTPSEMGQVLPKPTIAVTVYTPEKRINLIDAGLTKAEELLPDIGSARDLQNWATALSMLANIRRTEEGGVTTRIEIVDSREKLADKLGTVRKNRERQGQIPSQTVTIAATNEPQAQAQAQIQTETPPQTNEEAKVANA